MRTLLEFVAWLVCFPGQAGAMAVQKARQVAQPGLNSRQGELFLTEELSDVGVAVRRLQVSRATHVASVLTLRYLRPPRGTHEVNARCICSG